jgi:DENN domain-containing protein 5
MINSTAFTQNVN